MKLITSFVLFTGTALMLGAQNKKEVEKLAPYYPTPEVIVEKMLQMTNLKKGEKMFDLGSGDGRIVIIAAEKFSWPNLAIQVFAEYQRVMAASSAG